MKFKKTFLVLIAATVSLLFTACSKKDNFRAEVNWLTDYNEAKNVAEIENKGIILLFTGSDWDEYSKPFKEDVIETKAFVNKYSNSFVFLNLDFSEQEFIKAFPPEDASEEEKANGEKVRIQYEFKDQLARDYYSVTQYPCLYFLTKEGWYMDSVSYSEEITDSKSLMNAVNNQQIENISDIAEKVRSTEGTEKAVAVNELFDATPSLYLTPLKMLARIFNSLDTENETGFRGKFEQYNAYFSAYEALSNGSFGAPYIFAEAASNANGYLTSEQVQNLYSMAALMKVNEGQQSGDYDFATIIDFLEKAYKADPESEAAADLFSQIENVKAIRDTQD